MILEHGKARRAGVYLFFDKQGIADEYIIRMIEDLKISTEYMLVVCNGYVTRDSLKKLRGAADEVICRANAGFDLGAYRDGILYLGYKELEKYDEIIFVNYTFFGPIGSFERVFTAMETKDVDFWGLTKHHKVDPDPFKLIEFGYLPEHIQSHFIAVRRSLFLSYEYRDFVMNRRNPESYNEAICSYEAIFTKHFADLGYRWAVYSDTSEYEKVSFYPLMFKPADMVEKLDCPILKRRGFFTNYDDFIYNTGGEPTKIVYDRLLQSGGYDLDLLWDNLLRLENMSCLHRNMHLDYMCDPDYVGGRPVGRSVLCMAACPAEDAFVYKNMLAASAKAFHEIFIFGTEEEYSGLNPIFRECSVKHAGAYRSYAGFLKESAELAKEADLVLILDLSAGNEDRHERIVRNRDELAHLIRNGNIADHTALHFENNKRLGLLVPPAALCGGAVKTHKQQWLGRFEDVRNRMSSVSPAVNFAYKDNPLYPCGGSFWIRSSVLSACAGMISEEDDADLIKLILSLLVQANGSYTGRSYNISRYPKILEEQLTFLREANKVLFRLYGTDIHMMVRGNIVTDGKK